MAAAWESGWFWLGVGESNDYYASWDDTHQGLQFMMAEPRGGGITPSILYTVSLGMMAPSATPPKWSYWLRVVNNGSDSVGFVIRGVRVDS